MFLPEDYESPASSNNYMKFQDGENKFRILSKPVIGWLDWQDKKPVRYRMDEKPTKSFDPSKPLKHFWAMIVWNHQEEKVQILEITQATIRKNVEALCKDSDWGAPFDYDIKITKKGEGKETSYMVTPLPKKAVHDYIRNCFFDKRINLENLFEGTDPFEAGQMSYTAPAFEIPIKLKEVA